MATQTRANRSVSVLLDEDVHACLQRLQTADEPLSEVVRTLLVRAGQMAARPGGQSGHQHHFSYAEELERARLGVYECGGAT